MNEAKRDFTFSDNVDIVLLDVGVKSRDGQFVNGLTKESFQVFEDGKQQAISIFAKEDAPAAVGLVIDNSGSMRFRRAQVAAAGLAFVQSSNPKDRFFVVNFNDDVQFGLPSDQLFTDRLDLLRSALYRGRLMGRTALNDAVARSLQHLESSEVERRALIVVSDGGDNASEIAWNQLERMVEESRASIFTVGLLDPYDRDRNPRLMKKLATLTGGMFFSPKDVDEVAPVFRAISQEIRSRYTIGFAPDQTRKHQDVRKIKVVAQDASGKRLAATARSSFSIPRERDRRGSGTQSEMDGKKD